MTAFCDCLHLNIISCSCVCGNRWTHSHTWLASLKHGILGGTPNPIQLEKLKYESFSNHLWNVNGCFRCVPLQLGEGWTKPLVPHFQPKAAEVAKDRITQAQLDAELLK